ncbi:hypothetical protein SAMN02745126_02713 [Enhydrobacter aerosaccus]|uniref:Uncharacterized protein n=1 Tax=Enhydrobacter aerosaccus TaxID=225324 RepID=A0A1T4PB69_9HYPH|nr:hypothetical protein [Enhydrobacter aerosaccus]SJZ88762.1 hypothetical protein SAMN02745126_02713 [Enhydrobacter aerosaccus]
MAYFELLSCLRMVAEGAADYCSSPERPDAARELKHILAAAHPVLALSDGREPDIEANRRRLLRKCEEIDVAVRRSHLRLVDGDEPAARSMGIRSVVALCEELLGLVEALVPELSARVE